ncbi:MAG: hypothetical protein R3E39_16345 [Anaerolineae bacterium]
MTVHIKHKDQPTHDPHDKNFGPIVLIVIGILALLFNVFQVSAFGLLILPVIGLLFMGWGVYSHRFPLMIPGSIITGMGGALFIGEQLLRLDGDDLGGLLVLGLGLGFAAISFIAPLMHQPRQLWPLVPASILALVAVGLLTQNTNLLVILGSAWPLILIVIGLYLLLRREQKAHPDI